MTIHTSIGYYPKMTLPIYTVIKRPKYSGLEVGDKADVRVDDYDRQSDKEGRGDYNYIHEALVVGKRESTWSELEDMLKAFDANAQKREKVNRRLHPGDTTMDEVGWADDDDVVVFFLLRLDAARDFILDNEVAYPQCSEDDLGELSFEDYEGNG